MFRTQAEVFINPSELIIFEPYRIIFENIYSLYKYIFLRRSGEKKKKKGQNILKVLCSAYAIK